MFAENSKQRSTTTVHSHTATVRTYTHTATVRTYTHTAGGFRPRRYGLLRCTQNTAALAHRHGLFYKVLVYPNMCIRNCFPNTYPFFRVLTASTLEWPHLNT